MPVELWHNERPAGGVLTANAARCRGRGQFSAEAIQLWLVLRDAGKAQLARHPFESMPMRNAIFYLTYNGLYNFTNGIGTQTQLLISGLEVLREMLVKRYGPIDVHV